MSDADELPFDCDVLGAWLGRTLGWSGTINLQRIGEGHSNLTYALRVGDEEAVLRRPPRPPFPPGAHDVLREARIMRALASSDVPVPVVLAIAHGGEAMDVPFYVMEHLDGQVCTSTLPNALRHEPDRHRVGEQLVDALAALHAVDLETPGLENLGRPDGFLERQLTRLPRIIVDADGAIPPRFAQLRDALLAELPPCGPAALVHGDMRLGNVMLSRRAPARILGVLDWELTAIGDPLADLGYLLATYATPDEPPHALTAMSAATLASGFPSRTELAARYAAATGREIGALAWYVTLALWKLAVLFEYSRRRVLAGDGDPYYSDPTLVAGLLDAAETALGNHSRPVERTMR